MKFSHSLQEKLEIGLGWTMAFNFKESIFDKQSSGGEQYTTSFLEKASSETNK